MNTSVLGDLSSITDLSGELAATSLQCKIILVSATSCEEHNFSASSVTTFFPSILFKLTHFLSLTKTKCFPCSFRVYFPVFHSSKRKLQKRLLFSSLQKNFFQSRGTLVEGPLPRCACENPFFIVLILLSNGDDKSLLQSQRLVLRVIAGKHTQLALRTCAEEKPCLHQSISVYRV